MVKNSSRLSFLIGEQKNVQLTHSVLSFDYRPVLCAQIFIFNSQQAFQNIMNLPIYLLHWSIKENTRIPVKYFLVSVKKYDSQLKSLLLW